MARRRRRGTWLPNIGSAINEIAGASASGREIVTLPQIGAGQADINTIITPLTFDVPQDDDLTDSAEAGMSEIIGNEYVLERIVGKCLLWREDNNVTAAGIAQDPASLVTAGFFVARAADPEAGPGGVNLPIGAGAASSDANTRDNYSPIDLDTIREPWIWRRTWILGLSGAARAASTTSATPTVQTPAEPAPAYWPCSTALYGSVADGPHIDSQVSRRVSQDNRLWFAVSVTAFPLGRNGTISTTIRGYLDYRLYGSLRKARQQSAF